MRQGNGVFCWLVTKTQEMAADAFRIARKLFSDREAVLLTVEQKARGFVDHSYNFLQAIATHPGAADMVKLQIIQVLIDKSWYAWDRAAKQYDASFWMLSSSFLEVFLQLLGQRHMYVDAFVYAAIKERQEREYRG